jgi:hypothetical protein
VDPLGGESGNIEHTWGMYNKPTGCSTPAYRPSHKQTNKTWILTKRDRKQINIFERKVYRRILGPVYDNEKENWRILTNKENYASVKKYPP